MSDIRYTQFVHSETEDDGIDASAGLRFEDKETGRRFVVKKSADRRCVNCDCFITDNHKIKRWCDKLLCVSSKMNTRNEVYTTHYILKEV